MSICCLLGSLEWGRGLLDGIHKQIRTQLPHPLQVLLFFMSGEKGKRKGEGEREGEGESEGEGERGGEG